MIAPVAYELRVPRETVEVVVCAVSAVIDVALVVATLLYACMFVATNFNAFWDVPIVSSTLAIASTSERAWFYGPREVVGVLVACVVMVVAGLPMYWTDFDRRAFPVHAVACVAYVAVSSRVNARVLRSQNK